MSKGFFEVFPGLHIAEEFGELLKLVEVSRVTAARDRSSIRIYIESPRLIHKQMIYDLEKGIKEQLFPDKQMTIRIQEKYRLSGQYTPEKLLEVYKDSILLELKHYSIIEYTMFRKAQIDFPESERMRMTIEDTMVSKEKAGELKRILEKIFQERCGLPAEVEFAYVPAVESKLRIQARKAEEEAAAAYAAALMARNGTDGGFVQASGQGAAAQGAGAGGAVSVSSGAAAGFGGGNSGAEAGAAPAKGAGSGGAGGNRAGKSEGQGLPDRSGQKGDFGAFRKGGMKNGFGKGEKKYTYSRKSDNPDVLFGKDFDDGFISIDSIEGEMGEVTIRGKILTVEKRELRGGERSIIIFDVSDFTDTITVKLFARQEMMEDVDKAVVKGSFIKIRGVTTIDRFDHELTLGSVVGIKKCEDFTSKRMDTSLEKRVELHCHTKMSDMDGVSEVKDIIKRAKQWGMPAIAITDHGCVQAFTDANHALDKGDTFKIIYGVEGYLVDDLKQLVENPKGQSFSDSYVVFDIETTGFSPEKNRIIEIGAVKVEDGKITDKFSTFINPDVPIPFDI